MRLTSKIKSEDDPLAQRMKLSTQIFTQDQAHAQRMRLKSKIKSEDDPLAQRMKLSTQIFTEDQALA